MHRKKFQFFCHFGSTVTHWICSRFLRQALHSLLRTLVNTFMAEKGIPFFCVFLRNLICTHSGFRHHKWSYILCNTLYSIVRSNLARQYLQTTAPPMQHTCSPRQEIEISNIHSKRTTRIQTGQSKSDNSMVYSSSYVKHESSYVRHEAQTHLSPWSRLAPRRIYMQTQQSISSWA